MEKEVIAVAAKTGRCVLGEDDVEHIVYHEPFGEGDRHYCDIHYSDTINRVFGIEEVVFKK